MSVLKLSVSLVFVLVLLLAGCARESVTTTPTQAPTTAPTVQPTVQPTKIPTTPVGPYGTLKAAVTSFAGERFDPGVSFESDIQGVSAPLFDFMFRLDEAGSVIPGAVEKWEVAEDGLSWTYFIRKGIKFHDGSDLTAKDVKFSIDRYGSAEAVQTQTKLAVERTELVDDYTVRIYTKGYQPYLPYIQTFYSPAMGLVTPKDYFERVGHDYFERYPIGSGPFKLVRHVVGDIVEFESVDHWRKPAAFKTLAVIVIPEETTRVAMIKTGSIDVTLIGLESGPDVEASGATTIPAGGGQSTFQVYGAYDSRAKGKPIADVRVRQALSLAVNRDELRQVFFKGKAGPPTPPYIWSGSADVDYEYWKEAYAKMTRYDPEEAKRLLTEAGYAQGFSIKLYSHTQGDTPYQPKVAEIVQGYWSKIGVKAELVPTDWGGSLRALVYRGLGNLNADCVGQASIYSLSINPIAALRLRVGFHTQGAFALLDRAFPEVDKLLDGALNERDLDKRKEMLSQAIRLIVDSYTMVSFALVSPLVAVGPQVQFKQGSLPVVFTFFYDEIGHLR